MATLTAEIITGGSSVWGDTAMPSHPQTPVDDTRHDPRLPGIGDEIVLEIQAVGHGLDERCGSGRSLSRKG